MRRRNIASYGRGDSGLFCLGLNQNAAKEQKKHGFF